VVSSGEDQVLKRGDTLNMERTAQRSGRRNASQNRCAMGIGYSNLKEQQTNQGTLCSDRRNRRAQIKEPCLLGSGQES
jgi:hypothetical protein